VQDEFRVRAHLPADKVKPVLDSLRQQEMADQGNQDLGKLAVTHDDDDVFLYTDTAESAEAARVALARALRDAGVPAEPEVKRWHPVEERWEDVGVALPDTPAEQAAEHARLIAEEDRESQADGSPDWEVRITLPSRHAAHEFAERLQGEGIPVLRRWSHVVVGADDEDQARALAERLRAEAPEGSELVVEGSGVGPMQAYARSQSRYAWFGGLGM
jgi:hypothetical protein